MSKGKSSYTVPEITFQEPLNAAAQAWLAHRGITPEVADRNGLWSSGDYEIAFPVYKDGRVVNVAYRQFVEKEFRQERGAEPAPPGYDDCVGQSQVILVEGQMDKLAIESASGFRPILSVPSGSKPSDEAIALIAEACRDATIIILAGDMDQPGRQLMDTLAPRLGYSRCRLVNWGDAKDANDLLLTEGPTDVQNAITMAQPYPVEGIISIEDLYDRIDSLYDHGLPAGKSTGIRCLDPYYTVRKVGLTTVTGAPGSGKTTLLDYMLVGLTRPNHITPSKVGLCSTEMVPLERHAATLIAQYANRPFRFGPNNRMSKDEMQLVRRALNHRFWFVFPEEPTIEGILDRGKVLKERNGIDIFVIDPYNDIDGDRPDWMSATEYAHMFLRKVNRFDIEYDMHTFLVAHPRKLERKADGTYPVARPWDIADSAGFYSKSTNVLSVWRDVRPEGPDKRTHLHIQKIKFDEDGELAVVKFDFDPSTWTYSEADQGDIITDRVRYAPRMEQIQMGGTL